MKDNYTEHDLKEIFGHNMEISDTVRARVEKTYAMIQSKGEKRKLIFGLNRKAVKYIAIAAIIISIGSGSVYANHVLSRIGLVTGENKKELAEREIAISTEARIGEEQQEERETEPVYPESTILSQEYLKTTDDIYLADSLLVNIEAVMDGSLYNLPEFYFHNGDAVIITKSDDSGWNLKKGERLTINFDVLEGDRSSGEGSNLITGYIYNGECYKLVHGTDGSYSVSIKAENDGEYYFYLQNVSVGRLIISNAVVQ